MQVFSPEGNVVVKSGYKDKRKTIQNKAGNGISDMATKGLKAEPFKKSVWLPI